MYKNWIYFHVLPAWCSGGPRWVSCPLLSSLQEGEFRPTAAPLSVPEEKTAAALTLDRTHHPFSFCNVNIIITHFLSYILQEPLLLQELPSFLFHRVKLNLCERCWSMMAHLKAALLGWDHEVIQTQWTRRHIQKTSLSLVTGWIILMEAASGDGCSNKEMDEIWPSRWCRRTEAHQTRQC